MTAAEYVPPDSDIATLRRAAEGCRGCELWEPATQVVFSAGNPQAKLMLVGEQPGDVEDQRGLPFVGPAGQLLQRALADAEIAVADVYVTNAVKHFRFTLQGKRRIHATPQASHIKACRPWLDAELAQVRPDLVVLLGASAGKALLGSDFRITRDRGRLIEEQTAGAVLRLLATAHPSAVLRTPDGSERDQAYAALVADLRTAASLVERA